MPHHKNGDSPALCYLHQDSRGLPYLADASGSRGYLLPVHGLYGINNCNLGILSVNGPLNMLQACLTQEFQLSGYRTDAVCPHLNLF